MPQSPLRKANTSPRRSSVLAVALSGWLEEKVGLLGEVGCRNRNRDPIRGERACGQQLAGAARKALDDLAQTGRLLELGCDLARRVRSGVAECGRDDPPVMGADPAEQLPLGHVDRGPRPLLLRDPTPHTDI